MDREEILRKLQEATFAHLERDLPQKKKEDINAVHPDGWRSVRDRKWEFRINNIVLATIFHKPDDKFSLWFKTPLIYEKLIEVIGTTYQYDSLNKAQSGFNSLICSMSDWCVAVLKYINNINEGDGET